MPRPRPTRAQLKIDFEVDERVEELAKEFSQKIGENLIAFKALLGTKMPVLLDTMSAELASAAWRKFARHEEPGELIRCHDCDYPTRHDERVRVVVCTRCGMHGCSPGSGG